MTHAVGDWRPGCDSQALEARAEMLRAARAFFDSRGYLEVQTPCLSRTTASDPFLSSIEVGRGGSRRYLQTSPEFHMKRLLVAMPRRMYQICPAFRLGESGRLHNQEFTMLEWYAPGASANEMADFTCEIIDHLYRPSDTRRFSFDGLVRETLDIEVANSSRYELVEAARSFATHADEDTVLDCLYERALSGLSGRVLVHGFPAALASLAAIGEGGMADRFEVIIDGIEIANGCAELLDADEFRARTEADNAVRRAKGRPLIECDLRLEAALRAGLAPVSGVALGLDRLLMLKLGRDRISEILAFDDSRA